MSKNRITNLELELEVALKGLVKAQSRKDLLFEENSLKSQRRNLQKKLRAVHSKTLLLEIESTRLEKELANANFGTLQEEEKTRHNQEVDEIRKSHGEQTLQDELERENLRKEVETRHKAEVDAIRKIHDEKAEADNFKKKIKEEEDTQRKMEQEKENTKRNNGRRRRSSGYERSRSRDRSSRKRRKHYDERRQPKTTSLKDGVCRDWTNYGKCAFGSDCFFRRSHQNWNRNRRRSGRKF